MSLSPGRLAADALCLAAVTLSCGSRLLGFAVMGDQWPAGTDIVMHLSLSRPSSGLQDGSSSWNASAADALQIWNKHLQTVRFVEAGSAASGNGDGRNSVFFSNSVYGESFGNRTIAVTVGFNDAANPTVIVETDVIFNNAEVWNSYRGPLQYDSRGNPIFDFHRVALHEFGHVLGLDHPDQAAQSVHALMNSMTDDNDSITDDDIAGARHLYGALGALLGSEFRYQLRTKSNASNFAAQNLPPGLNVDASTGVISGVPNISGTYVVDITAATPSGAVAFRITIEVAVPPADPRDGQAQFVKSIPCRVTRFVADPNRPRMYATDHWGYALHVLDLNSMEVMKTIPFERFPAGLSISPDGLRLFVGNSEASGIAVIDLETLERLPNIPSGYGRAQVASGRDGRLYIGGAGDVEQIDDRTGTVMNYLHSSGTLLMTADRRRLYTAYRDHLTKYDISGSTPVLLQTSAAAGVEGYFYDVSADDAYLAASGSRSSTVVATADLSKKMGEFPVSSEGGPIAFSGDGRLVYQALWRISRVVVFDPRSFAPRGEINLPKPHFEINAVSTDASGAYLFIATQDPAGFSSGSEAPYVGEIAVYATGRVNVPIPVQLVPKGLANVSTRMRVQSGENVLIGGFIVQGDRPKTVIARAIGPSLSVSTSLSDPQLELHDSAGNVVATNDNWNSDRAAVLKSGVPPANEYESAIAATLPAGAYTAVIRGAKGADGVGLFELYDLDPDNSRIANISTRGHVDTRENVMIGGFIIAGDRSMRVIVRAIGPSLTESGVARALENPTLELHDGNGALLAANDDWRSDQAQEIEETTIPPANEREPAIVRILQPGNYTAIVRGADETTGVALVEVYNLEAN